MIVDLIKDEEFLSKRTKEFDVLENNQKKSIELVQDLGDTLESHDDMLWLTANMVGKEERAMAVKFNGETDVFMNPAFMSRGKMIIFREKDYINGKEYFVPRYTEVALAFQDCAGSAKGLKFNKAASIVACQALDMLDGIRVADYGLEITPEFDAATEEEKQEVLAAYIQALQASAKNLDTELSNDEETTGRWNAFKYIDSIAHGNTMFEEPQLSNRKKKLLKKFLKRFGKKI